ncbi:dUTPase [Solibacillus isronensis]|uniref:dUTPase n=1 Tax=Solibacillus isronensis TaxID=412383 RepID=UPI0039A148BD
MKKTRGFEIVADIHRKHVVREEYAKDLSVINIAPHRADARSAGYDFVTPTKLTINPGEQVVVWTDTKAYMQDNEVLQLFVRSSVGIKRNVVLANGTGIIDASYYNNPDNDGNIGICLINIGKTVQHFEAGERIAQGIFTTYLAADVDLVLNNERTGGIGSSGK